MKIKQILTSILLFVIALGSIASIVRADGGGTYTDVRLKYNPPTTRELFNDNEGCENGREYYNTDTDIQYVTQNCDTTATYIQNFPMIVSSVVGLQAILDGKFAVPTGSTGQYIRGNGTLATFPSLATVATSGAYSDLTGKPSLATVATSGSYTDLSNKPTIPTDKGYLSYQANASQTGTSAPSKTDRVNDFSGVTFTWARSSAGVYTITANSAVFTSGKTDVMIAPSASPLNNITATRTSSTVITITTSALNLLALGVSNTDAIISSTLFDVRVYP